MSDANPFRAPAARLPPVAQRTLSGMVSRFVVDGVQIEVETTHWSGLEVYRVDGQEVARERNLGWHSRRVLQAGTHRVEVLARWYPFLPVRVEVDGEPYLEDLFPQLGPIKWGIAAVTVPTAALLVASIVRDLWRLWVV